MPTPNTTVAIQGLEGSYHDIAASHYFGEAYSPEYLATFADVFAAVGGGDVEYGLVAVENSLVGNLVDVLSLLRAAGNVTIAGEITLGIRHSLIGHPDATLEGITEVHSHEAALRQCTDFVRSKLPGAVTKPSTDTVAGVRHAKATGDPSIAAIAGANNAEPNGMVVLQTNIGNSDNNYTRFFAITRPAHVTAKERAAATKTSLLIERLTDDTDELAPGTLYQALGCLARHGVALSSIQSRPLLGDKPFRYAFYVDALAGADSPEMQAALGELRRIGGTWKELGTYKQGETI